MGLPFAAEILPSGSLLAVDSDELASRYNECLVRLGIEPTELRSFHLDMAGWSPEVAKEKANPYYLSAGIANPMAVILSPSQAGLPLLFPYNSYDRDLMALYFERFSYEIADITRSACIGLDIDHELTEYETPHDLLLVNYIIARTNAGTNAEAARVQRALVERVLNEERGWFDHALRRQIIQSAAVHGDLRYRMAEIPDLRFDAFRSFHTKAFGGVFVLKPPSSPSFLVLEDAEAMSFGSSGTPERFHLTDERLPARLFQCRLIEINTRYLRDTPGLLSKIREAVAAELLLQIDPTIEFERLTRQQKKRLIGQHSDSFPDWFGELERALKRVSDSLLPRPDALPLPVQLALARPASGLSPAEERLIALLLAELRPWDIDALYRLDPGRFARAYSEWSAGKRLWAKQLIALSERNSLHFLGAV